MLFPNLGTVCRHHWQEGALLRGGLHSRAAGTEQSSCPNSASALVPSSPGCDPLLLSQAGAAMQQVVTEHLFLLLAGSAEHHAKIPCAARKGEVCTALLNASSPGKVRQWLGWELHLAERSIRQEHGSSQWLEGSLGVGSKQQSANGCS